VATARAAVAEGIVVGGGAALLACGMAARAGLAELEGDERAGAFAILKATEAPARQIAFNAGADGGRVVGQYRAGYMRQTGGTGGGWGHPPRHGYNAMTGILEDLVSSGVVDATRVTRNALQNAVSVAGMVLTTEAVVADQPDTQADGPAAQA
jgi:chaperonin GroEL